MIDRTPQERAAIKAARKDFAETLNTLGLMPAFFDRTPEDIDLLIEACIDGFQRARVAQQTLPKELDDEIPF